jgi:hypothetical protein
MFWRLKPEPPTYDSWILTTALQGNFHSERALGCILRICEFKDVDTASRTVTYQEWKPRAHIIHGFKFI